MQQLTQKLRTGTMKILEVPPPSLPAGYVLVRNYYSLISAGTEGSAVSAARKGYFGKARERPQQAKQVIEALKTQGPTQTYRSVMKKLDAYSPLGYSCCGQIIDADAKIPDLKTGDHVACGGFTACHSQIVSVPSNLCVKLKPDADLKQAAYNTLGAIALQGVRQADLRLGETCAVIGLGLLGQLSSLLLRASGIRVVGIDINQTMVDVGKRHCLDLALNRENATLDEQVFEFTNGLGCDAVIIAAASGSVDPINLAGAVSRKKGTIVVVGAVPTGFDREPHFYKKELSVKMSCSYGPGRYDPLYEEKGIDYPPAYVRWTENRNMQAFQDLLSAKRIDVSYLTTHTFKLDEAPLAYEMLLSKSEPFIGILIDYDAEKEMQLNRKVELKPSSKRTTAPTINVGFIGAGSYAQSHLLPNIPKKDHINLIGVMTATGTGTRSVGERFGFQFCTTDSSEILENPSIDTVFIATRHDSHARLVKKALRAGKHTFVEKPLCLHEEELEEIFDLYNSTARNSGSILMVGYNRRFSPLAVRMKNHFTPTPMAMNYRINAGFIPSDSWIQDPELGGGRIIGETCHFIDFLTYMSGSLPSAVHAAAMKTWNTFNDIVNLSITYENGSIGTITYVSNGDKSLPKERVEIHQGGVSAVLDDFKSLTIHAKGKKKEKRLVSQDKGQKYEVQQFLDGVMNGKRFIIPYSEIFSASLVSLRVPQSIRTQQVIFL